MKQEEKQLLFKDLCARVPYKVRCQAENGLGGGKTDRGVLKFVGNCNGVISNYYEDVPIDSGFINNVFYPIENIKPYLRPMSSMTEKEKDDLKGIIYFGYLSDDYDSYGHRGVEVVELEYDDWERFEFDFEDYCRLENWLNSHHFDYRGLIEKGLAIEASEGMYETKSE